VRGDLLIIPKQSGSPKSEVKAKRKRSKRTSELVNKKLKFFIKFKLGKKQYEINFKYDMETDNP
jgi:hypothetical protein